MMNLKILGCGFNSCLHKWVLNAITSVLIKGKWREITGKREEGHVREVEGRK